MLQSEGIKQSKKYFKRSVLLSLVSKNSKTLNRELTHSLAWLIAKLDKYGSGKLLPTPTLMQHFTLSKKLVLTFGYGMG